MKILSRYVGMQFFRLFLVSLFAFLSIYLIVEFFERIDDFLETGTPFNQAVGYFVYKIPLILTQVGPAAVLIASVFSLLLLGHNNELTAMRACGLNLYQISRPILVWGAIGSVVLLLAGEYLIPITNKKLNHILRVYLHRKITHGAVRRNKIWYRSENRIIWHIQSFDPDRNILKGVTLYRLSPKGLVGERFDAETVVWDGKSWLFQNGLHRIFPGKGKVEAKAFAQNKIPVLERPEDFKQIRKEPGEMRLAEMTDYIDGLRANGIDATKYVVDFHQKMAYPLVGIIMALVGIPFSLHTGRSGGQARSIMVALLIGFAYFILFYTGISLGHAGKLPPLVAAWATNVIFLAGGTYLMITVRG